MSLGLTAILCSTTSTLTTYKKLLFPPNSSEVALIENCTSDVSRCFLEDAVLFNPTKAEAVVFSTRQRLCRIDRSTAIDVTGSKVTLSDSIKLLGVTLDSILSFYRHVSDIVRTSYFHTRALKHITAYLSLDTAISVGVCIVATRLDYCNSLLYGTSNRNLDKLQRILNLLARTVATLFYWLPIR